MPPDIIFDPQPILAPHEWSPAAMWFFSFLILLVILEVVLKSIALWRSARLERTAWFVVLLLVNTAGVLPLVFLLMTKEEYEKLPKKTTKKKQRT